MVMARTAAMLFNRIADYEIDKRNPRTVGRHKLVSRRVAVVACLVASLLFVVGAWQLNPLCLALSPLALGIIFFYSLTKRFTHATQFFLGVALGIAPVGAWIAVTGSLDWAPVVLALAVSLWVAGFDIIYATQDVEFDREADLHSMVVRLGLRRSLALAMLLHGGMFIGLLFFGLSASLGWIYFLSLVAIGGCLLFEHRHARTGDVAAIHRAFFQANAVVGLVFVAATFADVTMRW